MYSKVLLNEIKKIYNLLILNDIHVDLDCSEKVVYKIVTNAIYKVSLSNNNFSKPLLIQKQSLFSNWVLILILLFYSMFFILTSVIISFFENFNFNFRNSGIILLGDCDSSSGKSFEFLNKILPESVIIRNFGLNKFKTFKQLLNLNNVFYYSKVSKRVLVKNFFFIFKSVRKINSIEELKHLALRNKFIFLAEFIKQLYVEDKVKFIFKDVSDKIIICSQDIAPFYAAAIDFLEEKNAVIVLIHGGCFFQNNIYYNPTISEYIFVPSNREKKYYLSKNGDSKVFSISIPLQQLCKMLDSNYYTEKNYDSFKYDILIIGGYGAEWENVLNYSIIKDCNYLSKEKRILLRHHPAADFASKKFIEDAIGAFELSEGKELEQDIIESDVIISYSVDSNITCLMLKKKIIYCASIETIIPTEFKNLFPNFLIAQTSKEFLQKYSEIQYIDTIIDEVTYEKIFIENFGDFRIDRVKMNIIRAISDIKNQRNFK